MGIRIDGELIIIDGDMSGNVVSDPINLSAFVGAAIQAIYTGSPDGDLDFEGSCQLTQDPSLVTEWTILHSEPISAAGNKIFNFKNTFYKWVRLNYKFNSGSGQLNATVVLKGDW